MPSIAPVPSRPVVRTTTPIPANPNAQVKDSLGMMQTPIRLAARNHDYATVKRLLDQGADPNGVTRGQKFYIDTSNVFFAAEENDTTLMKLLLDAGGDANFKTNDGTTPLMYAAIHGNVEMARLLLAKGANVNAKDSHNETALYIARHNGKSPELAAMLERAGGKDYGYKNTQSWLERGIGSFLHFLRPDFY